MSAEGGMPRAPSSKALVSAYVIAAHQLEKPPAFIDPISTRITPLRLDLLTLDDEHDGGYHADERLHVALCHRFADDVAVEAVASGAGQLVVMDAGLDTTCYRRPYPAMRLYELDTPDTQAWKRQRLADTGIKRPGQLTYVACDDDPLTGRAGLEKAGYDYARSTVVLWLGSTVFLPVGAVEEALSWLDQHHGRVDIVFDYLQPLDSAPIRQAVATLQQLMTQIGHPLVSFFDPGRLSRDFTERGFDRVEDLAWNDLLSRYLPDRLPQPDPLGGHIIHAHRCPA